MPDPIREQPIRDLVASPALRVALFYMAIFTVPAIHMPFFPIWLKDRGMSAAEIGILLALGTWLRLLANPFVAHQVDRRGNQRLAIILLAWASALSFTLFLIPSGFWGIALCISIWALLWSPIIPLNENMAMMGSVQRLFDYGRVRLWGSVSFMLVTVLGGLYLKGRSSDLVFWLILVGVVLTALASHLLPSIERARVERHSRAPFRRLASNPVFMMFVSASALVQGSHAVLYAFGTIHWRSLGWADDIAGLLWGIAIIAEITLFVFAGALARRMGAANLLLLAAAFGAVRWMLSGVADSLTLWFLLQVTHAITFGAAHVGAMHFIGHHVRTELSATAQGLYSMTNGATIGLGMFLAGQLYAAFGGLAYIAMAVVSVIAGGIMALLYRHMNSEPIG